MPLDFFWKEWSMQALILLKLEPDHVLQFSQALANSDRPEITGAAFLHGPFDCAVDIHAASMVEINEIGRLIGTLAGVADSFTCTVLHTWMRLPAQQVH